MSEFDWRRWRQRVRRCPELTAAQKVVLWALSEFADYQRGTDARPGEVRLADETRLTTRAVRAALAAAQQAGLVEQTAPANPGKARAAVYRLLNTGTAVPVDTGTAVPVDNFNTGAAVPVSGDDYRNGHDTVTGTATHDYRNGHDRITGTAVPPTYQDLSVPTNHLDDDLVGDPTGGGGGREGSVGADEVVAAPAVVYMDHATGRQLTRSEWTKLPDWRRRHIGCHGHSFHNAQCERCRNNDRCRTLWEERQPGWEDEIARIENRRRAR